MKVARPQCLVLILGTCLVWLIKTSTCTVMSASYIMSLGKGGGGFSVQIVILPLLCGSGKKPLTLDYFGSFKKNIPLIIVVKEKTSLVVSL